MFWCHGLHICGGMNLCNYYDMNIHICMIIIVIKYIFSWNSHGCFGSLMLESCKTFYNIWTHIVFTVTPPRAVVPGIVYEGQVSPLCPKNLEQSIGLCLFIFGLFWSWEIHFRPFLVLGDTCMFGIFMFISRIIYFLSILQPWNTLTMSNQCVLEPVRHSQPKPGTTPKLS